MICPALLLFRTFLSERIPKNFKRVLLLARELSGMKEEIIPLLQAADWTGRRPGARQAAGLDGLI